MSLKNNWEIDLEILNLLAGKRPKEYLADCIKLVEQVKDSQILHGLGEFLSEKEKAWVKKNLKSETIFLFKNYQSVL